MKRAVVTGGSGALGAAICRSLAAAGLHVIVHGHARPERAESGAKEIRAAGGSAETVVFDVCDGAAAAGALEDLVERGGPIQVIVSNAGVHRDAPERAEKIMRAFLQGGEA